MTLREDANRIIQDSIQAAMPDSAVRRALERHSFGPGRLLLEIGRASCRERV